MKKHILLTKGRKFFQRTLSGIINIVRFKQFLLQLQRTCKYISYKIVEACGLGNVSYKLTVTY